MQCRIYTNLILWHALFFDLWLRSWIAIIWLQACLSYFCWLFAKVVHNLFECLWYFPLSCWIVNFDGFSFGIHLDLVVQFYSLLSKLADSSVSLLGLRVGERSSNNSIVFLSSLTHKSCSWYIFLLICIETLATQYITHRPTHFLWQVTKLKHNEKRPFFWKNNLSIHAHGLHIYLYL